jgi:hypothetical protein
MIAGADHRCELFLPLQNVLTDRSGKGRTVTAVGSPGYADSPFGRAISLDGSTQYLTVPNSAALTSNDFACAAWVFPTTDPAGNSQIMAMFTGADTSRSWIFGLTSARLPRFVTCHSGLLADVNAFTGPDPIPKDAWSFLACLKSGVARTLMVNGAVVASSDAPSATIFDGDTVLGIGAQQSGAGPFAGRITRPMYFSRYVTPDEMRSVMPGFSPWGS